MQNEQVISTKVEKEKIASDVSCISSVSISGEETSIAPGAGGGVAGGGHEGFEGGVGWDAAEGEGVIEVGDVFGAATLGGLHGKNMVSALVEGGEKEGG